jgi:hypothetical protein
MSTLLSRIDCKGSYEPTKRLFVSKDAIYAIQPNCQRSADVRHKASAVPVKGVQNLAGEAKGVNRQEGKFEINFPAVGRTPVIG